MRNLLYYTLINFYGKKLISKALPDAKKYLTTLQEMIVAEFDKKTGELKKYLAKKTEKNIVILFNANPAEKDKSIFFAAFFKKLGINLAIEESIGEEPVIMLISTTEYLSKKSQHQGVNKCPIQPLSLFKLCESLCILLNIESSKKLRKAYDEALKAIGGTNLEYSSIKIMIK